MISKCAINDKEFLEWIENKELYEQWESFQKPKKTKMSPKTGGKSKKQAGDKALKNAKMTKEAAKVAVIA